jgi:hypothetical protein
MKTSLGIWAFQHGGTRGSPVGPLLLRSGPTAGVSYGRAKPGLRGDSQRRDERKGGAS